MGQHDPDTAPIRREELTQLLDTMQEPATTLHEHVQRARKRADTADESPTSKHTKRRKKPSTTRQPDVVVRFAPSTPSQVRTTVVTPIPEDIIETTRRPSALALGTTSSPPLERPRAASEPWVAPTPAIVAPEQALPSWVFVAGACAIVAALITLLMLLV